MGMIIIPQAGQGAVILLRGTLSALCRGIAGFDSVIRDDPQSAGDRGFWNQTPIRKSDMLEFALFRDGDPTGENPFETD